MVKSEERLINIRSDLQQRETHQRSFRKRESAGAICCQKRLEPLLLLSVRNFAPVLKLKRHYYRRPHLLERLFILVPCKECTQDRMAINDLLPGILKGVNIQTASKNTNQLLDINTRLRRREALKQHSFLHGGKWVHLRERRFLFHRVVFSDFHASGRGRQSRDGGRFK